MRISPLSSALAVALPARARAIVKACISCFIVLLLQPFGSVARFSGDRAFAEIGAGFSELCLQPRHKLRDRRRIGDLAEALARTPDVAPRLGLHVTTGAEIHLRLVGDREIGGIKPRSRDR